MHPNPKRQAGMETFDRLPKTVRKVLAAANYEWNAEGVLELYREIGAYRTAAEISRNDKLRCEVRMRDKL